MGSVIISIDAELAWGFVDFPKLPMHRLRRAREMWMQLSDLLEKHEIPATWAIVGHLFLEQCNGRHPDHPAGAEWFRQDPGGTVDTDEIWYAPDLIEYVIDADVGHDVGSHSFSHVNFENDDTSRQTALTELRMCQDIADEWSLEMSSFVFPRNRVGHPDVLCEQGFTSYRVTKPETWYQETVIEPIVKLVNGSPAGATPPTVTPTLDDQGLVRIPASLFLFGFEGRPRDLMSMVWTDPVLRMAKRGIDRAAATDELFHIWLHPNNIIDQHGLKRMAAIFSYIDTVRQEADLSVKTMQDIATELRD